LTRHKPTEPINPLSVSLPPGHDQLKSTATIE
jgi:hypothetical protein